jgi:hypothetical protein
MAVVAATDPSPLNPEVLPTGSQDSREQTPPSSSGWLASCMPRARAQFADGLPPEAQAQLRDEYPPGERPLTEEEKQLEIERLRRQQKQRQLFSARGPSYHSSQMSEVERESVRTRLYNTTHTKNKARVYY